MGAPNFDRLAQDAVALAEQWQNRANDLLTRDEKVIQRQLAQLLTHPTDKIVMTMMIDQSFRAKNAERVADQINFLFSRYGVPAFFTAGEKLLMRLFLGVGRYFPHVSVPRVIEKMRDDSSRSVIPGEKAFLDAHLQLRRGEGVRINVNHLGEAVLGEEEALYRLKTYIEDLKSPEIEYISVKISTIYSQIQSLAFEPTVRILVDRLSQLYRAARDHEFVRPDGSRAPKFVNLDMEEYRDLEITVAAFRRTLDLEEFHHHSAGIALQAYVPDSFPIQRELTEWARQRVAAGKSPIVIRIVKGANMEMEQVESALRNWPVAPYDTKLDVDANYKRMVEFGVQPDHVKAVRLGIASHNLFELAYAYKLAEHYGVLADVAVEMLEGMADHVRRAIQADSKDIVLYTPVATKEQFISAIAYLIRRLDENTGEENFLRHACNLKTGAPEWRFLKEQFLASLAHRDKVGDRPRRRQDRGREAFPENMGTYHDGEFRNEPDTDWALPANRTWAEAVRDAWRKEPGSPPLEIPLVIAGEEIFAERPTRTCPDSSRKDERTGDFIVAAVCVQAGSEDVARAVAAAKADPDGWRDKTHRERHQILSRVAAELRRARGDLIGAAALNTGKVFTEADVEVSEAVDFAEYYPHSVGAFARLNGLVGRGKGVSLVVSPWNFPIAIPCGGICASLAAGNTVIFKPASDAVLTAWRLCRCFWAAGVSKNTLQFVPCSGVDVGPTLTTHPDVDAIILTGGTETGMNILKARPDAWLAAETGGKNAMIVTAMSDRDQAVKDAVYSAFGNSGQKCSATSLLILEGEVYDDPNFKRQLVDAARSFSTGPAWDFEHKMGALIKPPAGGLLRALTRLEPGESWALVPQNILDNPYMWTPGIKWDVQPGGYTHMTEFFGPVLAVMRARDLDQAIELANQTGYGLTSGLQSLDEREQTKWKAGIKAGNLYINRGTTGAIVLRQPFGGMGKSALGAGIKVGGPNYVSQFMDFHETGWPLVGAIQQDHTLLRLVQEWAVKLQWGELTGHEPDLTRTIWAVKSYLYQMDQEFGREHDYFHLRGQDNIIRYLPKGAVLVRLHEDDSLFDVLARIAAVIISGCRLIVSVPPDLNSPPVEFLNGPEGRRLLMGTPLTRQTDEAVIRMMPRVRMIRCAAPERVPAALFRAAAKTGFYIARNRVRMEGRIELIQYFQEQSVCNSYHRYGNLGERALRFQAQARPPADACETPAPSSEELDA